MSSFNTQVFSNPKKMVIFSLVPVILVLAFLGAIVGLREVSLPYAAQIDELRLADPEWVKSLGLGSVGVSDDLPEAQLSNVSKCRNDGGEHCSALIMEMLKNDPANGRLWLEYSRLLTQENGLNERAIFALRKSFQVSAREGWITNVRSRFSLTAWPELPDDVKTLARTEILTALENYQFIDFLAGTYVANPIIRAALAEVMAGATVDQQRKFLGLVNRKSNS
jgi:hypothetical protein